MLYSKEERARGDVIESISGPISLAEGLCCSFSFVLEAADDV